MTDWNFEGEHFTTFDELAQAYGVNPSTARSRLARGESLEDALTRPAMTREACGRAGAAVSGWKQTRT